MQGTVFCASFRMCEVTTFSLKPSSIYEIMTAENWILPIHFRTHHCLQATSFFSLATFRCHIATVTSKKESPNRQLNILRFLGLGIPMNLYFPLLFISNFIPTVDGSEIPNNHLGYINLVQKGTNGHQPQLVSRISEPSTVSSNFILVIFIQRNGFLFKAFSSGVRLKQRVALVETEIEPKGQCGCNTSFNFKIYPGKINISPKKEPF